MGYREAIAKVIVETLAFTKPFIHFDRLAELGLVDVTNNGGTWRTIRSKKTIDLQSCTLPNVNLYIGIRYIRR